MYLTTETVSERLLPPFPPAPRPHAPRSHIQIDSSVSSTVPPWDWCLLLLRWDRCIQIVCMILNRVCDGTFTSSSFHSLSFITPTPSHFLSLFLAFSVIINNNKHPHSSRSRALRSFGFFRVWPCLVPPSWPLDLVLGSLLFLPDQPSVCEEFRSLRFTF